MAWWISGIVGLALIVLLAVLASALGSLRRFAVAALSLQRRLLDGQTRVQPRLERLQEQVEAMQPQLVAAQERALVIQARRGELDDQA